MPLTASFVTVADKIFSILDTTKDTTGLMGVFYGDQQKLPTTPVACVEPDGKSNSLKGAPRRIQVEYTVYILIYHSYIGSPEDNRKSADAMCETVEGLIHANPTLDGLVIHSMVTEVKSGYVNRAGQLTRASRLTVTAQSQSQLPMSS